MITSIREDRLVVVSDVHLGNPLYGAARPFEEFLAWAARNDYSLVLNGDGVDILQTSLRRLTRDVAGCARHFESFVRRGRRVYYTVGNHDIALEHFLTDWGVITVSPFLNVESGDRRIRIEHGHIYDDNFVRYPRTYDIVNLLGALALAIHPKIFTSLQFIEHGLARAGTWRAGLGGANRDPAAELAAQIPGEKSCFIRAALEIAERGFDAVVFGHTHRPADLDLGDGRRYLNTGAWMRDPHFLRIEAGAMTLAPVFGTAVPGTWSVSRGVWHRTA